MATFNHYFDDEPNITPAALVPKLFIQKLISLYTVFKEYSHSIALSGLCGRSKVQVIRGLI